MDRTVKDAKAAETGVLTLCGVQGCCPTVDFTNSEEVVIRDDRGGKVQLTRAEWADLKQKFAKPTQG